VTQDTAALQSTVEIPIPSVEFTPEAAVSMMLLVIVLLWLLRRRVEVSGSSSPGEKPPVYNEPRNEE